jgi:predicted dehydrogenase
VLDAGGYPMSMARLFAGVAQGAPFANPESIQAMATFHESGVDNLALATLRFGGDVLAQISTGISMKHGQVARLFGTSGSLVIRSPWFGGGIRGGRCELELTVEGEEPRTITIDDDVWLYEHEVDALTDGVAGERTEPEAPAMTWADSLGNMAALERWYRAIREPSA